MDVTNNFPDQVTISPFFFGENLCGEGRIRSWLTAAKGYFHEMLAKTNKFNVSSVLWNWKILKEKIKFASPLSPPPPSSSSSFHVNKRV